MIVQILIAIVIVIAVAAIGLTCYFVSENKKFRVTTYQIEDSKIPEAFRGTRFVFLTDLHNWVYGEENEPLLQAIEEADPDYILIGGDMIVKGPEFNGSVAIDFIMQLVTRYPVFYSFGNHELRISKLPETKDTSYQEFIHTLKSIGVTFLVDDQVTLEREGERIDIIGLNLSEKHYRKFSKNALTAKEIESHIGAARKEDYTILLAHNPRYFEEYVDWGANLVLSGHVHGGMIVLPWIGGVISTQGTLFPKYDFGEFKYKSSKMIVSRGLGNHTIKIRFNNRAELAVITLM